MPPCTLSMNKVHALRWILVLPAACGGSLATLMIATASHSFAEYLCPINKMISGMCTAEWYLPFFDGLLILSATLCAALIIVAAVVMAPNRKGIVALLIYTAGAVFALFLGLLSDEWWAFSSAVATGALITWIVIRKYKLSISF